MDTNSTDTHISNIHQGDVIAVDGHMLVVTSIVEHDEAVGYTRAIFTNGVTSVHQYAWRSTDSPRYLKVVA